MNKVYVVRYGLNNDIQNFSFDNDIAIGEKVIIQTDKGVYYGEVLKEGFFSKNNSYHTIIRTTTKEDVLTNKKNIQDAKKSVDFAKKQIEKHKLSMVIVNAAYNFDRTQLLFTFSSDDRVDFRQLAKDLAARFKVRIELRQIGTRDRSKSISGYGPCGQKLCCSRYLKNMDSVSINMAKNQNLALNPSKINGICNRLLCCLSYEDDVYTENRKSLPTVGSTIEYNNKPAVVKSLNILKKSCIIIVNKERIEVSFNEKSNK